MEWDHKWIWRVACVSNEKTCVRYTIYKIGFVWNKYINISPDLSPSHSCITSVSCRSAMLLLVVENASYAFVVFLGVVNLSSILAPKTSASARSTATKVLSPHSAAHLFGPRRQLGSSRRPQRPHAAREFWEGLRGQQWDEAGGDQRDLARERCFSFFNHGRPWWLVINN